jgi:hypothetical protein
MFYQRARFFFPAVLVGIADRWGTPSEDRLDNAGAGEMAIQCFMLS